MEIKLNGKTCMVAEKTTAADLLIIKGYKGKAAIWVNDVQLLLSEYQAYQIKAADEVRIFRIVGGG